MAAQKKTRGIRFVTSLCLNCSEVVYRLYRPGNDDPRRPDVVVDLVAIRYQPDGPVHRPIHQCQLTGPGQPVGNYQRSTQICIN